MEGWLVNIVVGVLGAAAGTIGAILLFKGKKLDNVYSRLLKVEEMEEKCREEVFHYRSELQSLYLLVDLVIQKYPDIEAEASKVWDRMKKRRADKSGEFKL